MDAGHRGSTWQVAPRWDVTFASDDGGECVGAAVLVEKAQFVR